MFNNRHCTSNRGKQSNNIDSHDCYHILGQMAVRVQSSGRCLARRAAGFVCAATPTLMMVRNFFVAKAADTQPTTKHHHGFIRRLFSKTDSQFKSMEDVAAHIKSGGVRKVVVMAGAGISTPSGIPDFRTPGTGLYDNLKKYNLPYAEAIFDIDYFHANPKPFFELARELYPGEHYRPNCVHYFVRLLEEKGLLHRMYTQNIDGLERLAGIPADRLVEAHGTFATATCTVCLKNYEGSEIKDAIFRQEIPKCKGKICTGVVKPDIVFFGEQLQQRFYTFLLDMPQADLLIVMGTSLEVQPFAGIAECVLPGVPRILFNREAAGPFEDSPRTNDVVVAGDLVEKIKDFCRELGWQEDLWQLMDRAADTYQQHQPSKPEE